MSPERGPARSKSVVFPAHAGMSHAEDARALVAA